MSASELFSDNVKGLKGSAIREILKFTQDPSVISFAGGLPAPESFPLAELSEIAAKVFGEEMGRTALQYGVTEGYTPLVECTAERLSRKFGLGGPKDKLLITSGAQQVIDFAAKVFLNPGDAVIVEQPSFVGALNCFRSYSARLIPVAMDDEGMVMEDLEDILKREKNVKLIYTIPTYQNPTGRTLPMERRKKMVELAERYNVYVIEDNPYGELSFGDPQPKAMKAMDESGHFIYAGTFSKILSPGMRLGYALANEEIIGRMAVIKQTEDVHTTLPTQMIAAEYMKQYDLDAHIEKIRPIYRHRKETMLRFMDECFPKEVTYTRPDGGIFLWCTLPEYCDTLKLAAKATERKVAFVPGVTFMVDDEAPSCSFRLNYSTMSDERIEKGIKTLGELLTEVIHG